MKFRVGCRGYTLFFNFIFLIFLGGGEAAAMGEATLRNSWWRCAS